MVCLSVAGLIHAVQGVAAEAAASHTAICPACQQMSEVVIKARRSPSNGHVHALIPTPTNMVARANLQAISCRRN